MAYKLVSPPQQEARPRYKRVLPPAVTPAAAAPQPSYWERVRGNLGPSAAQAASDIVQPIMHPIETAENLYAVGKGALQHAAGREGAPTEEMQKASALKQFYVDRYGSWEKAQEAFANDPIGVVMDASTLLTGGGGLAARAPGMVGKVGRATAAAGRAIDPVRAVTRPAGAVTRQVVSQMSGVTPDVYRIAAGAGHEGGVRARSLRGHLRGKAPIEETKYKARQGLKEMRQEKGQRYLSNMARSGANQAYIDMRPINRAFSTLDASYTHRTPQGAHYYKIDKAGQKALDDIEQLLVMWNNDPGLHSVMGLDALKQRIEGLRPDNPDPQVSRIYKQMGDAIRSEIEKQEPSYKKAMQEYAKASQRETDIEQALSLGENVGTEASVRRLTSAMRNNVNTNFGFRKNAMMELDERVPGLKEAIAGQTLNSAQARGLAAGTGPFSRAAAALIPLTSPRVMGEAAYYSGKFSPIRRNLHQLSFQAGRAADVTENERRRRLIRSLER